MNTQLIQGIGLVSLCTVLFACTPDDYTYHDNTLMQVTDIEHVELAANHKLVLADGYARLELYPRLYTSDGLQIPDDRVQEEWLEYVSESGAKVSRYFSTSDASLIGQTITARLKIKGTDLESEPISFRIAAPLGQEYTSDIRIPVIFHIIQTTEEIESLGGPYKEEQVEQIFRKLNYMLSGETTRNPVGTDTHIRLALAEYDPDGGRLLEPGINRLTIREIDATDNYGPFLADHHLIWPEDDYLNIWLISDRKSVSGTFESVSDGCRPCYVLPGTEGERLPGIEWKEVSETEHLQANDVGLLYKLQELDNIDRTFWQNEPYERSYNEIGYYLGLYLGLLPTCNYMEAEDYTDYCDDTLDYSRENDSWYKSVGECYFRSENIMDDPTGGHCSVSPAQCARMRWVLQHCAGRSAWQSNYAFDGKR